MPKTIQAKVLCRRCKCVIPRTYSETDAYLRQVNDGEWLVTPACGSCVTNAEIDHGLRWWLPVRAHLQPVP